MGCLIFTIMSTPNTSLIVHQAYRIGTPFAGQCQWRIAFLCPSRGLVEITRQIPTHPDEFEQAALVRQAISEFRNS
jgi:hypothetical protein